jgi:hypothetical protein
VIGGNFDKDDWDAIRVLDPRLDQSPGLCCRLPENANSCRGQPVVLRVNIPYLQPDHHRTSGWASRLPGDLEQSRAEEEHHCGICRRPELPVDGQAQDITVEAPAFV